MSNSNVQAYSGAEWDYNQKKEWNAAVKKFPNGIDPENGLLLIYVFLDN